jgi:energy-coupling factor transporter ATP-binding protein EcfA2
MRTDVLAKLHLVNFRSFHDFSISFGDGTYLVGPNNAGKSTILTALRTADVLIRYAYRRNPSLSCNHNDRNIVSYPLLLSDYPALQESVRHEFHHETEARFELTWRSGARLVAVWPGIVNDEVPQNFFYLEKSPGLQVRGTASARAAFPLLGVVPILTPIEHTEGLRDDSYVRASVSTRLSSRHFRNQLRLMREDGIFDEFHDYMARWLDGVEIRTFDRHYDHSGMILDIYYIEQGSQVPKELVWAGDGIQIWLQILYHIYRTRDRETIILDEPEVYLHPDLQRKLVHVLEDTGRQIVLATHSSEIIAEADPKLTTMVDKTRRRARRAEDSADLEALSKALGTAFNLRLARALRSKVALFVEGQDMTILRRLARTLEMTALSNERGVTVIPLEGYSRWVQVSPFAWLSRSLLPETIKMFVVLDHDYRPEQISKEVEAAFEAEGITGHVWKRKELENYLLTPSVIARVAAAPNEVVSQMLDEITLSMESYVFGQMLSERIQIEKPTGRHVSVTTANFKKEFDLLWRDPQARLHACPAKDVISELNKKLRDRGSRSVSARSLASAHRAYEISSEMVALLRKVEEATLAEVSGSNRVHRL